MPELIIRSGKLSGRKLVLPETEIVIGRDDDCQIRLTSADVSRRHCRILVTDEGLIARDLGSRNGTFVNEKSVVDAVTLRPGDKLRVGPMIFEVPTPEETITLEETEDTTVAPSPRPTKGKSPQKKKKKKKLYISLPSRDQIGVSDSSDDDIATWLSAGEEDEEASTGDTTIIPRSSPVLEELAKRKKDVESQKKPAPKTTAPSPTPPVPISPTLKVSTASKNESLEEEAAEIIRRHWESIRQKENS